MFIIQNCSWKLFCSYLAFLPLTKLKGKNVFLSHYGNLCPFYWENLCLTLNRLCQSSKKYTWTYVCDCSQNRNRYCPQKTPIKLLLPGEKRACKFVFIMLTGCCKRHINLLIPWKFSLNIYNCKYLFERLWLKNAEKCSTALIRTLISYQKTSTIYWMSPSRRIYC